jgi:pSer/pThr/pTyr-binding forkhead associated (FHA) protein
VPIALLAVLKLGLLALLYLFLWRTVRTVAADVYGERRGRRAPPPRPEIATPAKRSTRRAPRQLVVHPPEGAPQVVDLTGGPIRLGRSSSATVELDDVYVSDQHAEFLPDDDGWKVRDLGSTNGTYLNGAKVTQATHVSAGDQVRLGKTRVEVRR